MDKRHALSAFLGLYLTAVSGPSFAALPVTIIPDVYGDGEKVSAVAIEYPKAIDGKSLQMADYSVEGRNISKLYTYNRAGRSEKEGGETGKYVVIEFRQENTVPFVQKQRNDGGAPKAGVGKSGEAPMRSDRQVPHLSVKVVQSGDVSAMDGTVYPGNGDVMEGTEEAPSIIDEFKTYTYTDPDTGYSIPYNLYLPKDYDASKSYPLYFFVADASANINNDRTPLFQGNGATIFATEKEQAKHEAIILAPQYTQDLVDRLGMMTTDENRWTEGLTLVTDLLHHVISHYAVDKDRIYGSGQSQGGMANIAISDRYPDLFAAQYLVACQWDTDEMNVLKDKNLWILVSEGDSKAYPAMNTATENWEKLGTKVARSEFWDSHSTAEQFDSLARASEAQGAHIHYSVFQGGNHMYTWSVAYQIEGIRDWLFAQTLSGNPVSRTESGKYMSAKLHV